MFRLFFSAVIVAICACSARATDFNVPEWLAETTGMGTGVAIEPLGAEDFGAEDNRLIIPEPMVFDLVRPLGADAGEFEVNTLALFPLNTSIMGTGAEDPIGLSSNSEDRVGIEWAPEIEYAIADGLAIEFEVPFEDGELEAYKGAVQATIGTAFEDHYIHGFQVIVEPTSEGRRWETTFLYLGGIEFDEVWSMLFMAGFRVDLEGEGSAESLEKLFNVSLFADLTEDLTIGIETNHAEDQEGESSFLIVPQLHAEITDQIEIQTGVGVGFAEDETLPLGIIRVIYSR